MYYTYLLRCRDGTLYAGITTDLRRRFREHLTGSRGAKYTRSHPPKCMEAAWLLPDRAAASRLEYALKHMSRGEKEAAIRCGIPGFEAADPALLPKEESE